MTTGELRVINVTKSFGHVQALRSVSIEARPGEVTAVVGDNGAGKSTLIKTLSGVHRPDSGHIELDGEQVSFNSPREARDAGISTVFQDLALVEVLDVATNMFLDRLPRRGVFVAERRMYNRAADELQALNVRVPSVRVPVGMLSGGQRQAVAIARAVGQGSPIVLMDEPPAALGVGETGQVLDVVRRLRDNGRTIVMISHDLESVLHITDSIQVMRLGRRVAHRRTSEVDRQELVGLITGSIQGDDIEGAQA